jgi:hypothetical protein
MRLSPWRYRLPSRKHDRVGGEPVPPMGSSRRGRDGRGISETPRRLHRLGAKANTLGRAHKRGIGNRQIQGSGSERNIKLLHGCYRFAQFAARLDAVSPSAFSTFSLEAAVTSSCASVSPFWQFTAFSSSTYSLPKLPIAPAMRLFSIRGSHPPSLALLQTPEN